MNKVVRKEFAPLIRFSFLILIYAVTLNSIVILSEAKDLLSSAAEKPSASGKPSPSKLIALKVTGTTRYTDKEILAASGLQIGQPAAEGDFKEAVKRLGDSGAFTDLSYSYTSSNAGVKLELQLTDAGNDQLVPVKFENLVWFTDAELLRELQKRVPLFRPEVPLSGTLPDHVEETLQAILNEKQIPGRIDYLRETSEEGGKLLSIAYSVEALEIRIRNIEFPGATPDLLPGLQAASTRLTGGLYVRTGLAKVAIADYLPVCLRNGYLKASFGATDARVVSQTNGEVEVDAIFPLTPGKVYRTTSVDWKGNSAVTTAELAPLLHLPPGQPADAVRLLRDIESLRNLYLSRGYMMAHIKPDAQLDEEKNTVRYDLNVVEGDLYKMGELEILGLDTQATAHMRTAWTLHEGQPYDAGYPRKFIDDTRELRPRGVSWDISFHETPDPKDKTVDVEIRFKQQ
jgi:outer membrane protein assembly factor BamA